MALNVKAKPRQSKQEGFTYTPRFMGYRILLNNIEYFDFTFDVERVSRAYLKEVAESICELLSNMGTYEEYVQEYGSNPFDCICVKDIDNC